MGGSSRRSCGSCSVASPGVRLALNPDKGQRDVVVACFQGLIGRNQYTVSRNLIKRNYLQVHLLTRRLCVHVWFFSCEHSPQEHRFMPNCQRHSQAVARMTEDQEQSLSSGLCSHVAVLARLNEAGGMRIADLHCPMIIMPNPLPHRLVQFFCKPCVNNGL